MAYLLDTNILLRLTEPSHPQNAVTTAALATLLARGEEFCIAPQNLIEYYVVATRPIQNNGLGWSMLSAHQEIQRLSDLFLLLPDTVEVYPTWLSLITATATLGKNAHDAHLAATAVAHGVSHILTFNVSDFRRFESHGVTVVSPDDLVLTT